MIGAFVHGGVCALEHDFSWSFMCIGMQRAFYSGGPERFEFKLCFWLTWGLGVLLIIFKVLVRLACQIFTRVVLFDRNYEGGNLRRIHSGVSTPSTRTALERKHHPDPPQLCIYEKRYVTFPEQSNYRGLCVLWRGESPV